MARTEASDPLQNFRFHVRTETGAGQYSSDAGEAGFSSVTVPELSAEAVEYRDGTMVYTQKFSGIPTISDVTLMRGVTKKDSSFYRWMMQAVEGGEYRTNMTIYHWHRDGRQVGTLGDFAKARRYVCKNCFPIRLKPTADLDATASEVGVQEIDVAVESFTLEDAT